MIDTTTERRCDFTDLIAYSCGHCRGHHGPVELLTDYNDLPKELHADGLSEALGAATGLTDGGRRAVRQFTGELAGV